MQFYGRYGSSGGTWIYTSVTLLPVASRPSNVIYLKHKHILVAPLGNMYCEMGSLLSVCDQYSQTVV